jgi:putative transposase
MTVVPTSLGMWVSWVPFALPQVWPFCWWVVPLLRRGEGWVILVLDHFSQRCAGAVVFRKPPASIEIRTFLGRISGKAKPKYLVCDKGSQFWCTGFKTWCKRKSITPRFGAVGKHGSIAVIERFVRSLKEECTERILMPFRREAMKQEINSYFDWYNAHRPHESLDGRTPDEVYFGRPAANTRPRVEPRPHWPKGSSCASPQASVRGKPGCRVELEITYHEGRRHLPVIKLKRAG